MPTIPHYEPSDFTSYHSEQQTKRQRELADKITSYAPLDEIRILLACGAQGNEQVVQGLRPLHYAVYCNYMECVKLLLVRGSDLNALDEVGYSALHLSAEHGNIDLLKLLIDHDARVNFGDHEPSEPFPRAYKSEEPLRLAIKNGHYACAQLLLENGADVNARYFLGHEISLISATDTKFLNLLLLYGADPNVYDRDGLTPLMRAARNRDGVEAVELLIQFGANVNSYALARQDLRTPLHYAILSNNVKLVAALLAHGARVNMGSDYDKPAPLDLAVLRDQPEIIQMLLDNGGDPNAVYTYIGSPLHLACCSELVHQREIMEQLLKAGGRPNLCPQFEEGVLKSPMVEYFRTRENPNVDILRLLLSYGGEVVLKSPLMDPRGMLRNLIKVHDKTQIFELLLEASQEPNKDAIDRLNLPIRRRMQIQHLVQNPRSLKHLCRVQIRNDLRQLRPEKVHGLPLPNRIKNFLLYDYTDRVKLPVYNDDVS